MSKILKEFMCYDCQRKKEFYNKKIVREGRIGNLIYITEDGPTILLKPIDLINEELIAKLDSTNLIFSDSIIKFGKYEIEKFVTDELKNAIFVTRDLTYLFNTSIICEDVYVPAERIRKKLMPILKKEHNGRCECYKLNI